MQIFIRACVVSKPSSQLALQSSTAGWEMLLAQSIAAVLCCGVSALLCGMQIFIGAFVMSQASSQLVFQSSTAEWEMLFAQSGAAVLCCGSLRLCHPNFNMEASRRRGCHSVPTNPALAKQFAWDALRRSGNKVSTQVDCTCWSVSYTPSWTSACSSGKLQMKKCLPWLTFLAHCTAFSIKATKITPVDAPEEYASKLKRPVIKCGMCGLICLVSKQKPVSPRTVNHRRELNFAVKPCNFHQG